METINQGKSAYSPESGLAVVVLQGCSTFSQCTMHNRMIVGQVSEGEGASKEELIHTGLVIQNSSGFHGHSSLNLNTLNTFYGVQYNSSNLENY